MKILLTGSNGLLGQKLVSLLVKRGHEVIATSKGGNRLPQTDGYTYHSMDITNEGNVQKIIGYTKPVVVINTAAMTNVDQCELHQEMCNSLNVTAVGNLIAACENEQCHLIQLSTDFIFDGSHGPLKETEEPNPISHYGRSKLAAEELIINSNISWSIARTVLVYGVAYDMSRSNIVLWVKNSLENNKAIQVVNDQWRTPTLAEDLAIGCTLLAESKRNGIYHLSGEEMMTPYEIALKTAHFFKLDTSLITETDGSKFTQPAKRPPKTGFIIDKAKRDLGYQPHSFEQGLTLLDSQLS